MADDLGPFPVDDVTLSALEHAMAGAFTVDDDGTHHLVGAEFSTQQLFEFLSGVDRKDDSALELLSHPAEGGVPVYYDARPQYCYTDVILALIAEIRQIRGDDVNGLNGWALIREERERQVAEEGFDREHDAEHLPMTYGRLTRVPLVDAAICYAQAGRTAALHPKLNAGRLSTGEWWPWLKADWKPSADPVRNLAKAGALIAAEIDRLQRLNAEEAE